MHDDVIERPGGRSVACTDFGPADGVAVLWCHGGPGCRLDPAYVSASADKAGLRFVGIDRPGYGGSVPQPGMGTDVTCAPQLNEEQRRRHEQLTTERLPEDPARWLEHGSLALGQRPDVP